MSFLHEWFQRMANMRAVAAEKRTAVLFAMRYRREVTLGLFFAPGAWRRYHNDNSPTRRRPF